VKPVRKIGRTGARPARTTARIDGKIVLKTEVTAEIIVPTDVRAAEITDKAVEAADSPED